MSEEFNLSDKIVKVGNVKTYVPNIELNDVKEFIRLLKEEILITEKQYTQSLNKNIHKKTKYHYILFIKELIYLKNKLNKLAGDKLK